MNYQVKHLTRSFCFSLLTAAALLGTAHAATPAAKPPTTMSHGDMQGMDMKGMGTMGNMEMKTHMMKSMQNMQSMTMTGNADRDFAMMMRMHHQSGVEMAQMQLAQGKNAEMNALAKKIVAAQTKEIAQLDQWIAKQK